MSKPRSPYAILSDADLVALFDAACAAGNDELATVVARELQARKVVGCVASRVVSRGSSPARRAALLVAAQADVARLEAGAAAGWDVAEDLAAARRYVVAFSAVAS